MLQNRTLFQFLGLLATLESNPIIIITLITQFTKHNLFSYWHLALYRRNRHLKLLQDKKEEEMNYVYKVFIVHLDQFCERHSTDDKHDGSPIGEHRYLSQEDNVNA